MRTVRDADGHTYLLVKRSAESSRVRDPETGTETHLPNDELEPAGGVDPLEAAARAVPDPVRRVLTVARSERALGLLCELHERGALPVRTVLAEYDLCESDAHGLFTEFRAAGLVTEADVHGERGYELTEAGRAGVGVLLDQAPGSA
ncbi:DUF7346 family protein [Halarchaeum nitratireducens]|uniref:Uncharacterized protein n=1 Tax=Halarchaeum nitratireducens TaxID=489913 RepID=A0A830GB46_9EURY|nr:MULTISPECIES: hypothetical protein [Halarchaeum]MBP2252216.1 hypothetical protein [Halarchaeum solikamskense]GGN18274.1 hypothetical protein GCM10009021_18980 [Halarchaeum nitratireducens]